MQGCRAPDGPAWTTQGVEWANEPSSGSHGPDRGWNAQKHLPRCEFDLAWTGAGVTWAASCEIGPAGTYMGGGLARYQPRKDESELNRATGRASAWGRSESPQNGVGTCTAGPAGPRTGAKPPGRARERASTLNECRPHGAQLRTWQDRSEHPAWSGSSHVDNPYKKPGDVPPARAARVCHASPLFFHQPVRPAAAAEVRQRYAGEHRAPKL